MGAARRPGCARLAFVLACVLACGACAAPPDDADTLERTAEGASAIEGGEVDEADRSVVGVAIFDDRGSLWGTCSGTLIAPSLVLTAQHCVSPATRFSTCDDSEFGPTLKPNQLQVTATTSMWASSAEWLSVVEVITAPGPTGVCGRDLALLVLGSEVDDRVKPTAPRLDRDVEVDEVFAGIGYGVTSIRDQGAGLRRRRDALRVICAGSGCESRQVHGSEWRGDHGICSGDSGGPAIDRRGRLIGVTSRGPLGCDFPVFGGLMDFSDWLRSEAIRAARAGDYRPPAWAGDPGPEPVEVGSGCSSAARAPRATWPFGALAALALIALARRDRAQRAGARGLG